MFFYKIFYGFCWLLTSLPLRCLYLLSDFVFLLVFYIIRYRRKVVSDNLLKSFPEKTEKERRVIERKFYRHFCDMFIETIKLINISTPRIRRRIRFSNPEIFDDLHAKGKQIFIVAGHYGNWEWTSTLENTVPYHHATLYRPLKNKFFDKFFYDIRSKYGADIIPANSVIRAINKYNQENRLTALGFLNDQSPHHTEINHWITFMNQDTPIYSGVERLARRYNPAVVYYEPQRVKRGYYEVNVTLIVENASETKELEISEKFVRLLEQSIRREPQYWLWTHKRWKHKRS